MNQFAAVLAVSEAVMLLTLPKKWAALPLILGAAYSPPGAGIEIGPFNFSFIRLVIAAGFIRVVIRREWIQNGLNKIDWLIFASAAWTLFSCLFHKDLYAAFVFGLGFVYNTCGAYFLFRIFCSDEDHIIHLVKITAIILTPVAIEMLFEKLTAFNYFSILGSIDKAPNIRNEIIRANGPFAHAILAGTVGAVCFPMMVGIWRIRKGFALLGISACLMMIITSASSGPILSAFSAVLALCLWHLRNKMHLIRLIAVLGYIAMEVIMKSPAYYIIARLDFAGGSTGWHRAKLIESAIDHLGEWWLAGTDYTRHWMPTGVSWSPDHTDITNHYLQMGVIGGLPLTLLLICAFVAGFSIVGRRMRESSGISVKQKFFIWSTGASLFAHAVTCTSVSYFDQSFVFLYLTFGVIGSLSMKIKPV